MFLSTWNKFKNQNNKNNIFENFFLQEDSRITSIIQFINNLNINYILKSKRKVGIQKRRFKWAMLSVSLMSGYLVYLKACPLVQLSRKLSSSLIDNSVDPVQTLLYNDSIVLIHHEFQAEALDIIDNYLWLDRDFLYRLIIKTVSHQLKFEQIELPNKITVNKNTDLIEFMTNQWYKIDAVEIKAQLLQYTLLRETINKTNLRMIDVLLDCINSDSSFNLGQQYCVEMLIQKLKSINKYSSKSIKNQNLNTLILDKIFELANCITDLDKSQYAQVLSIEFSTSQHKDDQSYEISMIEKYPSFKKAIIKDIDKVRKDIMSLKTGNGQHVGMAPQYKLNFYIQLQSQDSSFINEEDLVYFSNQRDNQI